MIYYIYLIFAIILELIATSLLNISKGFSKLWPTVFCLLGYGLCFYFFSKSLEGIPLSIAYALWVGLGIFLIAIISIFVFKEQISFVGIIGICLIVSGVILVNLYGNLH